MTLIYGRAHSKLSRRRFLQGSGSLIALPLLQGAAGVSQAQTANSAQTSDTPERMLGLFVAMGLPAEITQKGFDHTELGVTPFRAWQPFAGNICMVRGLDVRTQGRAQNEHTKGCASFLCGSDYSQSSFSSKGGPTLDRVISQALNFNTPLSTLNSGVWGGDNAHDRGRIVHSWNGVDQPNEPIGNPRKLFEYIFGAAPGGQGSSTADKKNAYRKSVLDAVVADYRSVISDNSGFSSDVKNLISNHLETVRDLERRLETINNPDATASCAVPPAAPKDETRNGVYRASEIFVRDEWPKIWDAVTDLAILAYRCDLVRTGTMMVDSGGNDFGFTGKLHGNTYNQHEMLHQWRSSRGLAMEVWQWLWDMAAKYIAKLHDDTYLDPNGKTLLENATVVIGTELGDPVHSLKDMTFMIAGGKNRYKSGVHNFTNRTDVDLYNTILTATGITDTRIGTLKNYTGDLDSILR